MACRMCGGVLSFLGNLGQKRWFRCRDCGYEQCNEPE